MTVIAPGRSFLHRSKTSAWNEIKVSQHETSRPALGTLLFIYRRMR